MNPERILRRLVLPLAGIILFVIVISAIASGGGGGGSTQPVTPIPTTTTSHTGKLSHSAYVQKADRICAEANAAFSTAAGGTTAAESDVAQQLSVARNELASLQGLGKPTSDTVILSNYLSDLQDAVKALGAAKAAVASGDDTALASANADLATANAKLDTDASEFGFHRCGSLGQAGSASSTPTTVTTTPSTTATTPVTTTPTTTVPPTVPTRGTGGGTGGSTGGSTGGGGGGSGGIGPG